MLDRQQRCVWTGRQVWASSKLILLTNCGTQRTRVSAIIYISGFDASFVTLVLHESERVDSAPVTNKVSVTPAVQNTPPTAVSSCRVAEEDMAVVVVSVVEKAMWR